MTRQMKAMTTILDVYEPNPSTLLCQSAKCVLHLTTLEFGGLLQDTRATHDPVSSVERLRLHPASICHPQLHATKTAKLPILQLT